MTILRTATLLAALAPLSLVAAPGDLDLTFNGSGKAVTDMTAQNEFGSNIVIQPDGKIVLAGHGGPTAAVARYLPNGQLDPDFGAAGKALASLENGAIGVYDVIMLPDGKLLLGGTGGNSSDGFDFFLMRLTPDGTPDPTFGDKGKVKTPHAGTYDLINSLAVQSDGKILASGRSHSTIPGPGFNTDYLRVVRYLPDGQVDTTFNGTGTLRPAWSLGTLFHRMRLQNDGKMVLVGTGMGSFGADVALVRLHPDGSLDTTFGGTGIVTSNFDNPVNSDDGRALLIEPDGKIVIAGATSNFGVKLVVARYRSDGTLEKRFDGNIAASITSDLVRQPDGKLLTSTYFDNSLSLTRYLPDGSLDSSFGTNGTRLTLLGADLELGLAVQQDGRIVAGGVAAGKFTVARFQNSIMTATGPQVLALGAPAVFSVSNISASVSGTITGYQWNLDGVPIVAATGDTYSISAARPWHSGTYTVEVTTLSGSARSIGAPLVVDGVSSSLWRGLVAWYPCNGNAEDQTPGASHAVSSGAVLTSDRFGLPNRAYELDGVNDSLAAVVPGLPLGRAPRALSLWAKARSNATDAFLAGWGAAADGASFRIATGGTSGVWRGVTSGTGPSVLSTISTDSAWHHICFTGDANGIALYVDGQPAGSQSAAFDTAEGSLFIGKSTGAAGYFSGIIDDVRIYNRALTPAEVQQLYIIDEQDSDGDGLSDRVESATGVFVSGNNCGTDPWNADTDGDGFHDGFEVTAGFLPTSALLAPHGFAVLKRGWEFQFAAATGSTYRIEGSNDAQNWITLESDIAGTGTAIVRSYPVSPAQTRYFWRARRN